MTVPHMQICDKQYKSIGEIDEHLSSYDHHHKKRLKEMKQMELERTRVKRSRKEERRVAKEQERLLRQCDSPLLLCASSPSRIFSFACTHASCLSCVLFSCILLCTCDKRNYINEAKSRSTFRDSACLSSSCMDGGSRSCLAC
jgi:hypothetical protein